MISGIAQAFWGQTCCQGWWHFLGTTHKRWILLLDHGCIIFSKVPVGQKKSIFSPNHSLSQCERNEDLFASNENTAGSYNLKMHVDYSQPWSAIVPDYSFFAQLRKWLWIKANWLTALDVTFYTLFLWIFVIFSYCLFNPEYYKLKAGFPKLELQLCFWKILLGNVQCPINGTRTLRYWWNTFLYYFLKFYHS